MFEWLTHQIPDPLLPVFGILFIVCAIGAKLVHDLVELRRDVPPPPEPPPVEVDKVAPDMPDNVKRALLAYVEARLAANGNKALPLGELMFEFALWHGAKNLERGVLRPTPPPVPERTVMSNTVGEA